MSEGMPERMSDRMPERVSDRMSEDSERMSEDMSERRSEDMSADFQQSSQNIGFLLPSLQTGGAKDLPAGWLIQRKPRNDSQSANAAATMELVEQETGEDHGYIYINRVGNGSHRCNKPYSTRRMISCGIMLT